MSYQVQLLPSAVRAIRKLPPEAKRRIQAVLELLAEDPARPLRSASSRDPNGE
ncbi:hypothetical protein [Plantibacter flavus]|uniref:type II toxin-antitoxin system RelE family toxin n=1 Tax=Plantibacter flavus TaxID=150123 RepID=UPI002E1049A1